jgi:hypothetical protein
VGEREVDVEGEMLKFSLCLREIEAGFGGEERSLRVLRTWESVMPGFRSVQVHIKNDK